MPTPLLKNISFEKLFSWVLDYKFLKNFGCACFPNLRPYNSHKFSLQSKPCVFLGYSSHHKCYKFYHLEYGRMYISRDVVFHEDVFPFLQTSSMSVQSPSSSPTSSFFSLPINNITVSVPTLPSPSLLNTNSSNTHSPINSSSIHVAPSVTTVQSLDTAPPRLHPM